jgi:hypothetical protein
MSKLHSYVLVASLSFAAGVLFLDVTRDYQAAQRAESATQHQRTLVCWHQQATGNYSCGVPL